jgi:hypothetical protein
MQGVLQTTWTGIAPFARAYFNDPARPINNNAQEALDCFRALFRELRAFDAR